MIDDAGQIHPSSCTAFGITLDTRHAKAQEMIEMLAFAQAAAQEGIHRRVQELFYDSNSCTCTITCDDMVRDGTVLDARVRKIAESCLTQFQWHGQVLHGGRDPTPTDEPPF